jgi:hypothetical protein
VDTFSRLNIRPNFGQDTLPCDGRVGDVVILTPLAEQDFDKSPNGQASVWICIKASWPPEKINAVWARVAFDGVASCERPVPIPPQNRPPLNRG